MPATGNRPGVPAPQRAPTITLINGDRFPGPVNPILEPAERAASATRAGNVLTMFVTAFSDNTPGHLGSGLAPSDLGGEPGVKDAATFEVDQNGRKVASGDATKAQAWQATLGPGPASIRFTL